MALEETILRKIPFREQMIPRGDDRITPYQSDTLMRGDPDLVYRARDLKDVREILVYCNHHRIPVGFCGGRTCLTGAAVVPDGLLIAMEGCNRLLDLSVDSKTNKGTATAEPGIFLGDFQNQVAEAGWFYPPDPTSRNEAQLGGTVATNATGEDSLLYGPTRRYVRRLKILLADGREMEIIRKKPYRGPNKNMAGYHLKGDPIERFIGSEGTLGLITEITVDLLPRPDDHFVAWVFFPDLSSAIDFVVESQRTRGLRPRALELLDRSALEIVARQERAPEIPPGANAAISFKQEFKNPREQENLLGRWLALIEKILKKKRAGRLADFVQAASDDSARERFRLLRHAVPSTINEESARFADLGGGKTSTDWWVPLKVLKKTMAEAAGENEALGIPYYVYGHIGDGHPHINYIAKNHEEMGRVRELLLKQCRRAVARGGGVAGEHGLGKLHRNLLDVQCSPKEIEAMRRLKRRYDPNGILCRGNIFSPDRE